MSAILQTIKDLRKQGKKQYSIVYLTGDDLESLNAELKKSLVDERQRQIARCLFPELLPAEHKYVDLNYGDYIYNLKIVPSTNKALEVYLE